MTNHFSLARFLLWIPPLLWYRIIWGFSAQTASASGKVSDGLLHRILIVLSPAYARSEADIQGAAVEVLSFFERKAAHMFLYFLLVILLLAALAPFVRNILRRREFSVPSWQPWMRFIRRLFQGAVELHEMWRSIWREPQSRMVFGFYCDG